VTPAQIARIAGVKGKSLENALYRLRGHAFVEILDGGHYQITAAGRPFLSAGKRFTSGPRGEQPGKRLFKGTLRERAWHAMRIRIKFSLGDILERSARGKERDAESNVGKYLQVLRGAGFIAEIRREKSGSAAPTSNGVKRYLLVRDSGPQAPRWIKRCGVVYDPNTEEEYRLSLRGSVK
jgi:hypothetical protein